MIDPIIKIKFYELWLAGINAGLSSSDSREYASLELFGESFVKNQE